MSLNLLCWIFSDIKQFLMTALIFLFILGLIFVFFKFEQTRSWVGCLIVFVVFCTSLISGYKIYQYFSATGGTVGEFVSSIFGSSNAEKVGEYSFKFTDVKFVSTMNENEYKATYQDIYSNETGSFDLDMTKNWNIYINDFATNNNVKGSNYVFADYSYTFYNDELKEIFTDTLKIKFVFYKNYYQIDLITNNGETATEFWQSYFAKDNFIVSLKINDFISNDELIADTPYLRISLILSNYNKCDLLDFDINLKIRNVSTSEYEDLKTINLSSTSYGYSSSVIHNDSGKYIYLRNIYTIIIPLDSYGDYLCTFSNFIDLNNSDYVNEISYSQEFVSNDYSTHYVQVMRLYLK